ncbi:TetR/AcrR family transcriptional regulator [Pseudofrankia inefficax]|uniref:Regulatory protein TetR n=1 Tax=Pseudofrankia inefficax (strain DSM 45817 / CECT 9037 / DDB 130130 / EuI1c) TaxID=298654 RepID=E3J4E3_PSEI1|nr:TetR/AcrR family transcriptional regulator [Pseudofrankia inefficax]ADP83062.1 regulatory protein TetR [Pseudofrankia inefficax]
MAATRALRADAQRNRDRLLEVAVRALSQAGPDVPLEAIAKEAGVGIGTLYRHFPSREALVDAAYRNELDRLADAVDDLLRDLPPDRALRAWMDRFVDYLAAKRGMGDALRALIASGGDPFAHSRDRLTTAVGTLLRAGAAAGTLRADVAPDDILVSLSALSLASADRGDRDQAGRLLDLLMDALRVRA